MNNSQWLPDEVLDLVSYSLVNLFADAVSKQDWAGALGYTDSEKRIGLCLAMIDTGVMDIDGSAGVLAAAISGGDMPRRNYDSLVGLFEYYEYFYCEFDNKAARKAFDDLPDRVTIYRGTVEAEQKYGICWTLDREQAVFFATTHGRFRVTDSPPVILTTTVNREKIFALLFDRNESEVLVSPDFLGEVQSSEANSSD